MNFYLYSKSSVFRVLKFAPKLCLAKVSKIQCCHFPVLSIQVRNLFFYQYANKSQTLKNKKQRKDWDRVFI